MNKTEKLLIIEGKKVWVAVLHSRGSRHEAQQRMALRTGTEQCVRKRVPGQVQSRDPGRAELLPCLECSIVRKFMEGGAL